MSARPGRPGGQYVQQTRTSVRQFYQPPFLRGRRFHFRGIRIWATGQSPSPPSMDVYDATFCAPPIIRVSH
jgi:hypothetical protein